MSKAPIPISEKRLAANRANALHSTGPRTSEGKAASSRNAVKHGFTASSFSVVRLEDLQELANLKADAVSCFAPVNSQELFAIERIALAQMQILRGARLEAGLFTEAFNESVDPNFGCPIRTMHEDVAAGDIEITRQQNRNFALGQGFRRMAGESDVWSLMLRYQAKAERDYRRAVEEFERLKSLRAELPNEPNIGDQIAEPEDIAPPGELSAGLLSRAAAKKNAPATPKPPVPAPPAPSNQ